jgi:hypothetical protein
LTCKTLFLFQSGPPVIELGGGYAEGSEDLYVDQLEQKRRHQTHHRPDQHHQQAHHQHHQQDHHNQQHYQQQQHHQQQQQHHQQQQQQQQPDHLASFVDVDFEHFTPGQIEDIEPPRPTRFRHPNLENHPGNFSVLVSGLPRNPSAKQLARLFKDGSVDEDKHKAYITSKDVDAPSGFGKVTLPFIGPSDAASRPSDSLPPVFIAPVGYKVPAGYKGHPLPYDPSIIDRLHNREEVNLVHSTNKDVTASPNDVADDSNNPFLLNKYNRRPAIIQNEPTQEVQPVGDEKEDVSSTSLVLNKLKLARNRNRAASLSSFYKKKEHGFAGPLIRQPTGFAGPLISREYGGKTKKRKRILTKIVRKPYNPDTTTTSSTQHVSEDDTHTVVRIVNPTITDDYVEGVTETLSAYTTAVPLDEEQLTVRDEEDPEAATTPESYVTLPTEHFEPTTTPPYDNYAEPSDQVVFVTSPRPGPINFITRKPRITTPATTSSTTTTTTTTTTEPATTSTDNAPVYQPTPFSPLDPFKRLRFKKPTRKPYNIFGSFVPVDLQPKESVDSLSVVDQETTNKDGDTKKGYSVVSSPKLKFRKYGFNQGEKNGEVYGQRTRARKRPSTSWSNGQRQETYEYYPPTTESTTTTQKAKKEEYKKKFRPFFDQLYEQLTGSTSTTESPSEETNNRLPFWGRRSTTSPNPYTINAEIYEVYPGSKTNKVISTTQGPVDPETEPPHWYTGDYHDYPEEDYHDQAQPRLDDVKETLYVNEYEIPKELTTEHETADKHSTIQHYYPDATEPTSLFEAENYISDVNNNGLIDSDVSLEFGESQHTEERWNEVVVPPPRGLDSYQKDISLSHKLADHHNQNYQVPQDVINEHSQQKLTIKEGDFIPYHNQDEAQAGSWTGVQKNRIPYVQIQRESNFDHGDEAPFQISIEQVPTNDNDVILDVLEEVFKVPIDAVNAVSVEEVTTLEEDPEEDTTPTFFITPTTKLPETETETELPATTLYNEEKTDKLIFDTTVTERDVTAETTWAAVTEVEDEPKPTAEVDSTLADNEVNIDEVQDLPKDLEEATTTIQPIDDFEVTTFRPSFFDNFSLTNLLNYVLPSRTTTSTTTTTTTVQPEEEEPLEPEHAIVDAEVTKSEEEEEVVTSKQTTTQKTEAVTEEQPAVTEVIVEEEVEVTTGRLPIRLHRPKYPPTARDDYFHLESIKSQTEVVPTVEEVTTLKQDDVEAVVEDTEDANVSKDVFGAIRREEYFKNWVARKYRKPEDGKNRFTLSVPTALPTTTLSEATEASEAVTESNNLFPFAPTVLPSNGLEFEGKRRRKKISFLQKLKNSARSQFFKKDQEGSNDTLGPLKLKPTTTTKTTTTTTTTKRPVLYPRGSNTNLFRKWGGGTLSQAEFEKTILGVSTATDVSVQTRICVRGHCFNADDKAAASSFHNNKNNNFR